MKSKTSPDYWACYRQLTLAQRKQARKAYRFWRDDPYHPSLHFKRVSLSEPLYSVRVSEQYRSVGLWLKDEDLMIWFWIGSHAAYDKIIGSWQ